MSTYADVIVDITSEKLDRPFTYLIPEALSGQLKIGMPVFVPFGKGNRVIKGYIVAFHDGSDYDPGKMKEVLGPVTEELTAEARLVALAAWMKDAFGGTFIQALRTVLPVKRQVRIREKKMISLAVTPQEAALALAAMQKKHHTARARLLGALLEEESLPQELVLGRLNIQTSVIKALQQQGLLQVHASREYRDPMGSRRREAQAWAPLTGEQQQAVDTVRSDWAAGRRQGSYLLHGVTGSGKTRVYMELIADVLARGEQAIVLIPEIALTYQTVLRFYRRFGDRVSFIHSRLSAGERYDQYERALTGEISVMIGPRSALFTPFPNLGIIVIDEEHERSYLSETVPRYNARLTAKKRAELEGACLVCGSATPSLDAYYEALKGESRLLTMTDRVGGALLPAVQIVDLREELKAGNRTIFSRRLCQEIENCYARGEQSMLFLNRRGFAGFVSCRSCGHVITCPHCDVSLSLHKGGRMVCHYCGYETKQDTACPSCGSPFLRTFRAGTEQIEQEVHRLFPKLRTLRMDADTTKGRQSHEDILSAFAAHQADILIGTQMIVKGHDFPKVTLMGILAADLSLHVPDYRAAERTFQLLTQAAGRAGRDEKSPGRVIIQTYDPDHYAVRCAAHQDYRAFYEQEMEFRTAAMYPPQGHLTTVHLSGEDPLLLEEAASYLKLFAQRICKRFGVYVLGPADAPIAKLQDQYRKQICLKGADAFALARMCLQLQRYVEINEGFRSVNIQYEAQ